ncbi:hypothetical protein LSTR_LSTR000251 [Laodelphax striatellus]|uniref:Odorant receptor n=1 Tax=Laodelphax striatellus TaxID=195883 RepID=A0A482X769_LAOST|nr:hypothetical protein LSTR_LSTR000251 [Laodelphax striatellus]
MEDSASSSTIDSRKSILTLPPTIISRIYLVVTCILQLNLAFSLYARWHDFIQRLITLKDLILTLFCSLSFMRLMCGDTTQLCRYIEEHVLTISIDKKLLTEEKNSIILNRELRFETTNKIVKRYFYLLTIVSGLIPYIKGLKAALIANFLNKNVKLHFLLSIHYPEEYKSLLFEMIVQTLLLLWYIAFVHYWITDMKVMSLSFQCITTEMELLRNSIENMDNIIKKSLAKEDDNKIVSNSEKTVLQSYISGEKFEKRIMDVLMDR